MQMHTRGSLMAQTLIVVVVIVGILSSAVLVSDAQQSRGSRPMFFDEFVVEPTRVKNLPVTSNKRVGSGGGSILQALLESQYSEFVWYLDKASLLHKIENFMSIKGSITIFAPKNSFLEQHLDAEFRDFLLQDGNELLLQRMLQFHVLPVFLEGAGWSNRTVISLSGDAINLRSYGLKRYVEFSRVFSPNSIIRNDGIVHGVNGFLIPRGVSYQFEEWKRTGKFAVLPKRSELAVLPKSAPEGGRAVKKRGYPPSLPSKLSATAQAPEHFTYFAPAPVFAPAPAPGPSQHSFTWDDEEEVAQFMTSLTNFGGYNDMAELLVNYTSLAAEIGRLVNKGYRLTILAPNDEAMAQLTPELLNSPLERILYYHILSEYQTEESMYNAVRRLGVQTYSTLQHPLKLSARESDGTVLFGEGENSAHIYDHDIYIDGRLSIQGISKVLIPPSETPTPLPSA